MSPASAQCGTHSKPFVNCSDHFKVAPPFCSSGFPICMFLASWILFLPHFRKLGGPVVTCNTKQIKALSVASRDWSLQQLLPEHISQPLARNPHLSFHKWHPRPSTFQSIDLSLLLWRRGSACLFSLILGASYYFGTGLGILMSFCCQEHSPKSWIIMLSCLCDLKYKRCN